MPVATGEDACRSAPPLRRPAPERRLQPAAGVAAAVSFLALCAVLLPLGLFLPVPPGTRQVTVGGAVAADVQGNDHHVSGCSCDAVERLDLLVADGTVRTVGPDLDPDLVWATAGGMGHVLTSDLVRRLAG